MGMAGSDSKPHAEFRPWADQPNSRRAFPIPWRMPALSWEDRRPKEHPDHVLELVLPCREIVPGAGELARRKAWRKGLRYFPIKRFWLGPHAAFWNVRMLGEPWS